MIEIINFLKENNIYNEIIELRKKEVAYELINCNYMYEKINDWNNSYISIQEYYINNIHYISIFITNYGAFKIKSSLLPDFIKLIKKEEFKEVID